MSQYVVSAVRLRITLRRTTVALAKVVRRAIPISLVLLLTPAFALAQQSSKRRTEIGGDLRWLTGVRFNDVNANETAFGGTIRKVFNTSTSLDHAACPEARFVVGLTSSIDVEGSVAFGRSHLTTRITQDPEASETTASEAVTLYLLEGGVTAHVKRLRRGRVTPTVSAGIGYFRQLHDSQTFIESGPTLYAGGGLRFPLNDRTVSGWKSAVLRLEVRATILTSRSTLDNATHVMPAVIGGLLFHF
jgi:hypothetical protein